MVKIGVIISSTRDARFADKPAQWILEKAKAHDGLEVELIDLRDYDLPFFNEKASNLWMPSEDERAIAWQNKLAEYDGFIFVVAEYNHSMTGALKNALDQAYKEWLRKPAAYFGYGSMGAVRAVEHLRLVNIELQMVPTRNAVHLGGADFFKIHPLGGGDGDFSKVEDNLAPSADAMLDELVWWAQTLKAPREASAAASQ